MGGLSKKSFLVNGLSDDPRHPAVLISSGNMLFAKAVPPAGLEAARIGADGILRATRTMGGKVMGLGSLDLAAGASFLRPYHQPSAFSLLSLNLVVPGTTTPLFAPIARMTVGDVRIAVLGLTDHTAISGGEAFQVLPWQDCLAQELTMIGKSADFILLLSNYPLAVNQDIAGKLDGIDCILQSGHVLGNMVPIVIKNTLISQTEIRGKYLGMLDIHWTGHGRWHDKATASREPEGPLSTYSNRFIALKPSMRSDPAVEAIVSEVHSQIEQAR